MYAYTGFAYVYDEYMDNIPYEECGQYLMQLLQEQGVPQDGTLVDLGCGTGTVTRMLDKSGDDCSGIDMTEVMHYIA